MGHNTFQRHKVHFDRRKLSHKILDNIETKIHYMINDRGLMIYKSYNALKKQTIFEHYD